MKKIQLKKIESICYIYIYIYIYFFFFVYLKMVKKYDQKHKES